MQELFDHDAGAGIAELVVRKHHVHGVMRFFERHRHDHALAGGQTICLDDDRGALRVDIGVRERGVGERFVVGRGNAVALHERLGEVLRRFKLRGFLCRAEDLQTARAEDIDDTGGKRRFRADHRECDTLAHGEFGEHVRIADRHVAQALVERRATVARCDINQLNAGRLGKLPRQRVFAPARSDNQNFHLIPR